MLQFNSSRLCTFESPTVRQDHISRLANFRINFARAFKAAAMTARWFQKKIRLRLPVQYLSVLSQRWGDTCRKIPATEHVRYADVSLGVTLGGGSKHVGKKNHGNRVSIGANGWMKRNDRLSLAVELKHGLCFESLEAFTFGNDDTDLMLANNCR
jgi:hypothetical protein